MSRGFPEGSRWVVIDGISVDGGRVGTVVAPCEIPMRDLGFVGGIIPDIAGYYLPADWGREVPLIDDSGAYFTMHKACLVKAEDR